MLAKDLSEFRNLIQAQGIIFCYSGYITEAVLSGIGEALKQKLYLEDADKTRMRNIFAIFVEQMQNVIRYSAENDAPDDSGDINELRYGILNIGVEDDKFFITCGNKVQRAVVARLSGRLADLQKMTPDELKSLFKEKLRGPTEATSKGAGVGFIEIARRSSEVFDFGFMDIDDRHTFFALKAFI
ncbi:MAG: SiaB family protein kinase [Rhodospirillaceae bacterium]